ncbi:PA2169 family four-helix-bundle protein [Hymenobacter sp. B1770]|uniref:PA2169 family four-helix-bundle protein n=1 Tax=Hymenobacter sp. B1770 TaxID=1718788 RepID=UPI003CF77984
MSHPNTPRVSTDSAASQVLSHAGDDQAQATGTADAGATASSATDAPAAPAGGAAQLLSQAQRWLQDSGLKTTLSEVPAPLKHLASQAGSRWRQLSTTQKVLGGALLAAGGWYLLSGTGAKPTKRRRTAQAQADALHELLLFVNDRVAGYQRAADESKDAELQSYYKHLMQQSKDFSRKLNLYLGEQDGGSETSTTLKGKFYRAWMDSKAAITGYSETAILGSNVYGEEWALKAYEEALQNKSLNWALRSEIQRQYTQSQKTYERLQDLQRKQQE